MLQVGPFLPHDLQLRQYLPNSGKASDPLPAYWLHLGWREQI